jgi:hypothetical protein
MTNEALQALIKKVAAEVGCPTTFVELAYRDYGADGGYGWACITAVQGAVRAKSYRPSFAGYADSPEAAVEDLLASNSFRQWKDPEGFQAEQGRATKLANLKAWLADGTLTQDEHDQMVAKLEAS